VEFSKDQVVELLQERGQTDQAAQAESELPEQVDTEQHSDLLAKFGIDPQELITKFGGGLLG
jgi:DNA-binding protein H-NS